MQKIVFENLNKSFKGVQAVKNASFQALPGRVTGFLGPNGSGKTTTLAMLAGLLRADSGIATIGGKSYRQIENPCKTVGISLSAYSHPAHTGQKHLKIMAQAIGADLKRVDYLLDLVGLRDAAKRRSGGYSLGMRQRLALATALLGDPDVLILDEPVNGLDPEGIRWIRDFLRFLASEGKTVLLSSHLLREVEQTVDDIVVIKKGEIVYQGELTATKAEYTGTKILVDSPDRQALHRVLIEAGLSVAAGHADQQLSVEGISAAELGSLALNNGVALSHLSEEGADLEGFFMRLTGSSVSDQEVTHV